MTGNHSIPCVYDSQHHDVGIWDSNCICLHAMDPNPIERFALWFRSALNTGPGDGFDPTAMTLATSDKAGDVTARVVLLKQFGEEGFTFYTNYGSRKAKQLAENPRAALVFHWPYQQRQVRIEGEVEKVSRAESEEYFHSRPREHQLGAAVSPQSEIIPSRESLEEKYALLQHTLADREVPLPENWGGYRLVPISIEFWQHRENRLHDRLRYRKNTGGQWILERLAP